MAPITKTFWYASWILIKCFNLMLHEEITLQVTAILLMKNLWGVGGGCWGKPLLQFWKTSQFQEKVPRDTLLIFNSPSVLSFLHKFLVEETEHSKTILWLWNYNRWMFWALFFILLLPLLSQLPSDNYLFITSIIFKRYFLTAVHIIKDNFRKVAYSWHLTSNKWTNWE